MSFIIAICGGTASGKTSLAKCLKKRLGRNINMISEDDYYLDSRKIPDFDEKTYNFDEVKAKDHALLLNHLNELKSGNEIDMPMYSFGDHTRTGSIRISSSPYIVIEGIHILSDQSIIELIDFKVFLNTPDDIRLARRVRRDVEERERSVKSVIDSYLDNVRPMHQKYTLPSMKNADIVIDYESSHFQLSEAQFNDICVGRIMSEIG